MAEKLGLSNEVRELKLGSSFDGGAPVAYHSIRYDFKPASVDTSQVASVDIGEGHSVTVTVPHVEGSGTSNTVYKGNKRECQKECILVIDHKTGEITLEKLSNNITLKKTSFGAASDNNTQGERWRSKISSQGDSVKAKYYSKSIATLSEISILHEHAINRDDGSKTTCTEDKILQSPSHSSVVRKHKNKDQKDIIPFCESIACDIYKYLSTHTMDTGRRPYVSASFGLRAFRKSHPELYKKAVNCMKLTDVELDNLTNYLCQTYNGFLVKSCNVYGSVQLMEDVINFIVTRFIAEKKL